MKTYNSSKYSKTYGIWAANTIGKMLKNRVYLGHMVQGKERRVSYKSKKVVAVPESEHIVVENTHAPIIDKKTFNTVQSLMASRRTVHKPKFGYKGPRDAHLLAGRLRCADCGSNMHRGTPSRDGKTHHMRCNLSNKTKSRECTPHSIKLSVLASAVEGRIREIIRGYLENVENINAVAELLDGNADIKKEISRKKREAATIDREIQDNNGYLAAAFKEKIIGRLTEEEFDDLKTILQNEILQHKGRKAQLEKEIAALTRCFCSMSDIEDLVKGFSDFDELDHAMVNEFVDYIEIGEKAPDNEQEVLIYWLI